MQDCHLIFIMSPFLSSSFVKIILLSVPYPCKISILIDFRASPS
ncbi:Protein kinase domain-containing protein [Psidium guajava]|nr:Protein kinase domain-containing protein [Psidium guajava]